MADTTHTSAVTSAVGATTGTVTSGWRRYGGLAAVVGGTLLMNLMAWDAAVPALNWDPTTPGFATLYALLTVGGLLVFAACYGVHVAYRDRYGRLGLLGVVVAALGSAAMTVGAAWTSVVPAAVETVGLLVFLGTITLLAGSTVLGVGLWRVGFDRFVSGLLVAAFPLILISAVTGDAVPNAVGYDVGFMVTGLVGLLGWVLLGARMRTAGVATEVEHRP